MKKPNPVSNKVSELSDSQHPEPPVIDPPVCDPVQPTTGLSGNRQADVSTEPAGHSNSASPAPRADSAMEALHTEVGNAVPPALPIGQSLTASDPTVGSPMESSSVGIASATELVSASKEATPRRAGVMRRLVRWPAWCLGRSWDLLSLLVILAVVAAVPLLQLASLGYLLVAAANLAQGQPWSKSLPGLRLAGKLGSFALLATLTWLPVWLVTDLSYSAQLLQPGSATATQWRVGAFLITGFWVTHLSWAAMRGGRWWHMLWPAPIRFLKEIWRPQTWRRSSDALYDLVASLQFPKLWWLGARAALGALLWVMLPVSLMIIGLRGEGSDALALVGLLGALGMTMVMLYLPFLQIQFAADNRIESMFNVSAIRRRFRHAPWAHAIALLGLCFLCIPLYLLRIEATPAELVWAPSLVFVVFMLPAKVFLGAAMGYADRKRLADQTRAWHWTVRWTSRWSARLVALASVLVYVGALYVAQLVAGQGALVMYFQHAFLVPAPLI